MTSVRSFPALLVLSACVTATASLAGCSSDPSDASDPDCGSAEACAQNDALSTAPPPFTVGAVRAARYPIVLHHGFNASQTNSWSFYKVKEALEADGHDVTTSEVEPFNGVPVRAQTLAAIVDNVRTKFCQKLGYATSADLEGCERTMKVNIIAHSMGGLDARYLAATLGYAPKIASITTLSTPHGGSNIADVGLGLAPDGGKLGIACRTPRDVSSRRRSARAVLRRGRRSRACASESSRSERGSRSRRCASMSAPACSDR